MAHAAVIWAAQTQHLDEAELMLTARQRSLGSPLFTLDEVAAGPERRLLEHVDGLIMGGRAVVEELLLPSLTEPEEPGHVGVATLALLYGDDADGHAAVRASLDAALAPELRRQLSWALGRCTRAGVVDMVAAGLAEAKEEGRLARLEVFVHQQLDVGPLLSKLIASATPDQLPACAWLLRSCSAPEVAREWLAKLLDHTNLEVQAAAIESGLILGAPAAWDQAVALARTSGPLRGRALTWVVALGDLGVHERLIAALGEDDPAPLLRALGHSGRRKAVDACLDWLEDPRLGPLVAELMHGVAGLPREQDDGNEVLWQDREPDDDELPPLDEDLETELDLDPDELLPMPAPEVVRAWWEERRPAFEPGVRYLLGRPHGAEAFAHALRETSARRRPALAFELAARSRGQASLDCGALCAVQRAQLRRAGRVETDWRRQHPGGPRWR